MFKKSTVVAGKTLFFVISPVSTHHSILRYVLTQGYVLTLGSFVLKYRDFNLSISD